MRQAGLAGIHRRTGRAVLTRQDSTAKSAPDLAGHDFTARAPNLRRTADMTYVPTFQDRRYRTVALDLFARHPAGRAMADHMRTEPLTDALATADTARRPPWTGTSQRQWVAPVHGSDVRSAMRGSGHPAVDRQDWILLRLSVWDRVLFRIPGNRAH